MFQAVNHRAGHLTVQEVALPPSDKLRANEAERQQRQRANANNALLKLPAELRLRIYELTMLSPRWYHDFKFFPKWLKEDCPLLDVSQQIRAEALPVLVNAIGEICINPTDLDVVLKCIAVLDDQTIAAIRRFKLCVNARMFFYEYFYAVDLRGPDPVVTCADTSQAEPATYRHGVEILMINDFQQLAAKVLMTTMRETGECVLTRDVLAEVVSLYSYKLPHKNILPFKENNFFKTEIRLRRSS